MAAGAYTVFGNVYTPNVIFPAPNHMMSSKPAPKTETLLIGDSEVGRRDKATKKRPWQNIFFTIFFHRIYLALVVVIVTLSLSYGLLLHSVGTSITHNRVPGKFPQMVANNFRAELHHSNETNTTSENGDRLKKFLRNDTVWLLTKVSGNAVNQASETEGQLNLSFKVVRKNGIRVQDLIGNRRRRKRDSVDLSQLDELATFQDGYPVRLTAKSNDHEQPVSDQSDTTDPDLIDVELDVANKSSNRKSIDDLYAKKCQEWLTQHQQKALFHAASKEIKNIRNQLEMVIKSPHIVQLDVKNHVEGMDDDRLLVQKTIFEVLSRFGGSREAGQMRHSEQASRPVWAKEWK